MGIKYNIADLGPLDPVFFDPWIPIQEKFLLDA